MSWLYDLKSGNEAVVDETKDFKGTLIPVISLSPLIDHEFGGRDNIIDFIKKNGVGAVRLFPNDHNYTLHLWNCDRLFSLLDELRIPVLIECRPIEGSIDGYFDKIVGIARTYNHTPIILLTTGYRSLRIIYEMLDKCRNIYIDTSTFLTYRGIEDVTKLFGSERIMFGTRMPFIEGGVSVGRVIYADISEEDKEKIAFRNILRLLQELEWLDIRR